MGCFVYPLHFTPHCFFTCCFVYPLHFTPHCFFTATTVGTCSHRLPFVIHVLYISFVVKVTLAGKLPITVKWQIGPFFFLCCCSFPLLEKNISGGILSKEMKSQTEPVKTRKDIFICLFVWVLFGKFTSKQLVQVYDSVFLAHIQTY